MVHLGTVPYIDLQSIEVQNLINQLVNSNVKSAIIIIDSSTDNLCAIKPDGTFVTFKVDGSPAHAVKGVTQR